MKTQKAKIGTLAKVIGGGLILAVSGSTLAGIVDTKHNLGSTPGGTGANTNSATTEICVFCHTPHGSDTDAVVPLWNKNLDIAKAYTTYDQLGTSTLDGQQEANLAGSVSLACLSCHDGSQAMDSMLNEPGSGTETGDYNTTWTGNSMLDTGITFIGTDLRNDHPVGIQYGGGGFNTGALDGPGRAADFIAPSNAVVNGTTAWWVNTTGANGGSASSREKKDMILYTRAISGIDSSTPQPFVECASCHDPHTTSATFLRMDNGNDGSQVCLACHTK